eukprot:611770-Rhodomonas_salina.1
MSTREAIACTSSRACTLRQYRTLRSTRVGTSHRVPSAEADLPDPLEQYLTSSRERVGRQPVVPGQTSRSCVAHRPGRTLPSVPGAWRLG